MKKLLVVFITIIIIIIGVILYSRYIETSMFKTNEIKIEVENLSIGYNGLKIVHFTDLHYGRTIKEKNINKIVQEINDLKPDIVAFTGDLFDGDDDLSIEEIDILTKSLSNINSKLGKFAIKGNHDVNSKWNNVIEASGFIDLNDKYQLLYDNDTNPIMISGISSNIKSKLSIEDKVKPIDDFYNSLSVKPTYSILLIHEPDYIDKINIDNYNLILAGHSHGGQIKLPFINNMFMPEGAKKYYDSYYKVNNTDLYVSNGLGTSTISYRFMCEPSMNMFRIVKK